MYHREAMSETSLARAVHILSLGAYAWEDDGEEDECCSRHWRDRGGGGVGGVFHDRSSDSSSAPTVKDWIAMALLRDPVDVTRMACYRGEECALQLLRKLADDGGCVGWFVAQDPALRAGAAWLCDYAVKYNPDAAAMLAALKGEGEGEEARVGGRTVSIVGKTVAGGDGGGGGAISGKKKDDEKEGESDFERRRRKAKEMALARMKAQMERFAKTVDDEGGGSSSSPGDFEGGGDQSGGVDGSSSACGADSAPLATVVENDGPTDFVRGGGGNDGESNATGAMDVDADRPPNDAFGATTPSRSPPTPSSLCEPRSTTPRRETTATHHCGKPRLLHERPRCIVCGTDGIADASDAKTRKGVKTTGDTDVDGAVGGEVAAALAFCGYSQASTVAKGGGGAPPPPPQYPDASSGASYFRLQRNVGVHVTLCGHAIHDACCEAYLKSSFSRRAEDRLVDQLEGGGVGKKGEFRCPLCQRLSNCLVPFIDVGLDWAVSSGSTAAAPLLPAVLKSDDDGDKRMGNASGMEDVSPPDVRRQRRPSQSFTALHRFLSQSKWWIARNNPGAIWDGSCTVISSSSAMESHNRSSSTSEDDERERSVSMSSTPKSPGRSMSVVRSFGKKDLVHAWNAVMRTPRLVVRHQQRGGRAGDRDLSSPGHAGFGHVIFPRSLSTAPSSTSHREHSSSSVWRRLMDQISDVAQRVERSRLGEDDLSKDFGEFRHYLAEKAAHNKSHRAAGRATLDCIPDVRKQELSREKLISKLLFSIQAFAYSCCAEAAEVRRLVRSEVTSSSSSMSTSSCSLNSSLLSSSSLDDSSPSAEMRSLYSKFGIGRMAVDGELILLPEPTTSVDGGTQPFDGRLGKLRYLALAIMVATSAVSREVVQLAMSFPLDDDDNCETCAASIAVSDRRRHANKSNNEETPLLRTPVAYPILCGHALTHTTAALCAVTGRARAQSDFPELVAKSVINASSCSQSGNDDDDDQNSNLDGAGGVVDDCENFVKLGLIARTLQCLLGHLKMSCNAGWNDATALNRGSERDLVWETTVCRVVNELLSRTTLDSMDDLDEEECWKRACLLLLRSSLSVSVKRGAKHCASPCVATTGDGVTTPNAETCHWKAQILVAVEVAKIQAVSFLRDMAVVAQIVVPHIFVGDDVRNRTFGTDRPRAEDPSPSPATATLVSLMSLFRIENLVEIVDSNLVPEIVRHWYEEATTRNRAGAAPLFPSSSIRNGVSIIRRNIDFPRIFPLVDWPIVPCERRYNIIAACRAADNISATCDRAPGPLRATTSMVACSSSVPLLGHCASIDKWVDLSGGGDSHPRIRALPASYTDLYAELCALCPDSEQTALCLVCGQVMNALGKGECTKHAYKCGGGAAIFFLLQECVSLLLHGPKAAYMHSPYVDNHGETPQYRGRPLNLDEDRYNVLRGLWLGHLVREKVVAERGNTRQVIIANFY